MKSSVERAPLGAGALLERGRELAVLEDVLGAAANGSGRAVVVRGAAGLGKSRLLATARGLAGAKGMEVAHARGDDLESGFSFGVALQLFEPIVARPGSDDLFAGAAGLAGPIFGSRYAKSDDQPYPIMHGLHWLAANVAERRPLLIAVDDAHWADELSLRFVRYLLQRLDELAVALVLSVRSEAAGPQARLVARIADHPLSRSLELEPLSAAAVALLVRERIADADDATCAAAAAATGGNPFYLRHLLDPLGPGDSVAPLTAWAPESAADTVLRRLQALDPAGRDLAASVAVLGDGASLEQAAKLAGMSRGDAALAADALAHAAILEPGLPLRFRHPIVRDAVYGSVPPVARAQRHAGAARLVLERGDDPELAASHIVRAGGATEPWAVAALREAALRARRRGAPDASVRYLRAARLDGLPRGQRSELLVELAHGEARTGADGAAARAVQAVESLDPPDERARVALRLGFALADGGGHDAAVALFERGLSELGERGADSELAATLRAVRGAIAGLEFVAGSPGGVDAILDRTARGVATSAERLMLAHAAFATGLAGRDLGTVRRLARGALEGADPDAVTAVDTTAAVLAASALLVADDLVPAERAMTAAVDAAARHGSVTAFASASHVRAHTFFRLGRLADAIADAQAAVDAARYGWDPALPAAHAVLANALVERGELTAANRALVIPGGVERWASSFTWNDYLEARAHLALAQDDPHSALADALACGDSLEAIGAAHPSIVPWRSVAAHAAARVGEHERAARLAEEDVQRARAFGAGWALGRALRTAGELAGGSRGVDLLREAVAVLEASDAALERAHALASLGDALAAEHHRLAAREPLRQALELAHRCGAEVLEQRVRAALVSTGARPRRSDISGRDALTPRELRIARMAGDGMSNREIAEALFITRKTVETHLAHAFRKLNVSSRKALAEALDAG